MLPVRRARRFYGIEEKPLVGLELYSHIYGEKRERRKRHAKMTHFIRTRAPAPGQAIYRRRITSLPLRGKSA